jgi:rod shape-determining protein MreC
MSDEQVPVGETVLTSGGDQIFPKGLPVGTVSKVGSGKDLFLNIKIKPAANLSKLEEVLVLLEKQDRLVTADDKVRVRAADILAQRLPSVPDRPAANAASVGVGTDGAAKPANGSAATPAKSPASPTTPNGKTSTTNTAIASQAQPHKQVSQAPATQKQKTDNTISTPAKKDAVPVKPSVPEQKAPTSNPANSQPAADDNSPN